MPADRGYMQLSRRFYWCALLLCLVAGPAAAQRSRVHGPVDNANRVRLSGNLHPNARVEDDQGRMDPSQKLASLTLAIRPSAEQQAALEKLLAEQQDPASPNYQRWLTPEEYGARFGASDEDLAKVSDWLRQQNLTVAAVGRARNSIAFSGTAGDVERAFRTEMHRYLVRGRRHFANSTEPSIPVAFDAVIGGVQGLDDFRLQPRSKLTPRFTSASGFHYLSPADLAVIYNIKPLYDGGYTGNGQKIVVVGQTQVDLTDTRQFRTRFQLPANDPDKILVPFRADPGVSDDDVGEANLDLQWAGAVAPDAKILYVYSNNVLDAIPYAIDQNLAPVISVSYGLCELATSRFTALAMQSWARQASAQGITWLNASGDSGGADCVRGASTNNGQLAVDLPAAVPEVTAVGGTEFAASGPAYWNSSNAPNGLSALQYIPETTWNDSQPGDPLATGGGSSIYFTKPVWQTGPGVPADNARNLPDVSLTASPENVGYLVYLQGRLTSFGGTSAGAPALAGITALLNQYLTASGSQVLPGVGNINPQLYILAQRAPQAFHDITTGHNIVDVVCTVGSRNCVSGSYGYNAGPGYDQATGLGSVDAFALVSAWREQFGTRRSTPSVALVSSAAAVSWGDTVALRATVQGETGVTPRGSVTFYLGAEILGSVAVSGSAGSATATLLIGAVYLGAGANTITAEYSGDSAFDTAKGTLVVTVTPSASSAPAVGGVTDGASFRTAVAPGALASIFGTQLAPVEAAARNVPLPAQLGGVSALVNAIPAPFYYISPGQLNVQIPYETPPGPARITVNNNGQTSSIFVTVDAAAPGIFTDASRALVPTNRASGGQVIEMYMTGAGAVTPTIATGAAPSLQTPIANLPRPTQAARVTVGGVDAAIIFIGIPPALAGVTQVNFRVPATLPAGVHQVVVTIGGVDSTPALLTVN